MCRSNLLELQTRIVQLPILLRGDANRPQLLRRRVVQVTRLGHRLERSLPLFVRQVRQD